MKLSQQTSEGALLGRFLLLVGLIVVFFFGVGLLSADAQAPTCAEQSGQCIGFGTGQNCASGVLQTTTDCDVSSGLACCLPEEEELPFCRKDLGGLCTDSGQSVCIGVTVSPTQGCAPGQICCVMPSCNNLGGSCTADQNSCTAAGGTVDVNPSCTQGTPYCCIPAAQPASCQVPNPPAGPSFDGVCINTVSGVCTSPSVTSTSADCQAGTVCCYDSTQHDNPTDPTNYEYNPDGGLVPCDGPECNACNLVELMQNVLRWLILISVFLVGIVIAWAGMRMVMSAGNVGEVSAAKTMMTNAVVGIVILLAAWLIIDTVMKMFVGDELPGFGPWNQIDCVTQPSGGTTPVTEEYACATGDCVALSTPCKNGCQVDASIADAINSMHTQAGVVGARVTEAMPPSTDQHVATCHYDGTCIDYGKAGGMTPSEVRAVIVAAEANGLRPVYEVATDAQKMELVNGGVNANYILVLGSHITAPHFSIYAD